MESKDNMYNQQNELLLSDHSNIINDKEQNTEVKENPNESTWNELVIPDTKEFPFSDFVKQIVVFFYKSVPNLFSFFAISFYYSSNTYFVKRQNSTTLLAAYGLGYSWITILGFSIYISFSIGTLTQYSYAFGAKQYKKLGEQLWCARAFAIALFIILFPFMYYAENIFIWCGISQSVASLAGQFTIWAYPSLLANGLFDTYRYFLYGQNIWTPSVYSSYFSYLLNFIWLYLLVEYFQFGIQGVAACRNIAFFTNLFALQGYMKFSGATKKCEVNFSFKYLKKLKEYLIIVIPTGAPDYLKWIIMEVMTIIIGKLNDENILAGHTACGNNLMIFFMFNIAVTIVANAELAKIIGKGNVNQTRNLIKLILSVCSCVCIQTIINGMLLENVFVKIFCVGDEMTKYFILSYRFMIFGFLLGDYFQTNFSLILKCYTKQNIVTIAFIFCQYGIGLPLTYILTLKTNLGYLGAWISIIFSVIITNLILILILYRSKIDEIIENIYNQWKENPSRKETSFEMINIQQEQVNQN